MPAIGPMSPSVVDYWVPEGPRNRFCESFSRTAVAGLSADWVCSVPSLRLAIERLCFSGA